MNDNKCIECNKQTEAELTALRAEIAEVKTDRDSYRQSCKDKQDEIANYIEQLAALRSENERLREALESCRQEAATGWRKNECGFCGTIVDICVKYLRASEPVPQAREALEKIDWNKRNCITCSDLNCLKRYPFCGDGLPEWKPMTKPPRTETEA